MLEVRNLSTGYGKKNVSSDLSFLAEENKLTVILGPNGCGKTTLLKTLCGVLNKKGGCIFIDNQESDELSKKKKAEKIAYMPQERHIPDMIVFDFLMCSRYPYLGITKTPGKRDLECVEKALEKAGAADYKKRRMNTLSGGERQKVYIAMALAQETDIILLDEPIIYLDIEKQFEIMNLIRDFSKNKTILMVCHDIRISLKYADNLIVMDKGKIVKAGRKEEILSLKILEKIFNIKINKIKLENEEDYIINME